MPPRPSCVLAGRKGCLGVMHPTARSTRRWGGSIAVWDSGRAEVGVLAACVKGRRWLYNPQPMLEGMPAECPIIEILL